MGLIDPKRSVVNVSYRAAKSLGSAFVKGEAACSKASFAISA